MSPFNERNVGELAAQMTHSETMTLDELTAIRSKRVAGRELVEERPADRAGVLPVCRNCGEPLKQDHAGFVVHVRAASPCHLPVVDIAEVSL